MIDRSNFFYQEKETKGVGDATTVSSGPDNGANNAVACAFWRSMRNGSTNDGINQLLNRYQTEPHAAQNFNISGHGNMGFVETGKGQGGAYDYAKIIWLYNQRDWEPELRRIANLNYGIFSIYSCDTGAGTDGAALLFNISKVINKPVRARTGLTNGVTQGSSCWIEFQNGSTWQVATPDMTQPPAPINPPPHLYDFKNVKKTIEVLDEAKIQNVSFNEVAKIEVVLSSPYYSHSSNIVDQNFHGLVLENLFLTESFRNDGDLLGIVTLTINLFKEGAEEPFTIDIYNNRLATIRNQNVSFFISDKLVDILIKTNA